MMAFVRRVCPVGRIYPVLVSPTPAGVLCRGLDPLGVPPVVRSRGFQLARRCN